MLKGKKVIVTGGNGGIGKEIATLFFQNKADVAIFGTNEEKSKKAVKDIERYKEPGQKIIYKVVDVSKTQNVKDSIDEVYQEFEGLDVLVNNAGIARDGFLIKMKEEDWDRVIQVNLKSVFNTCKASLSYMIKQKKGKIINIASIIALIGNACQANYSASKAGMIGFTKSLAKEYARKNILVNCIAPGFITTKMTESLQEKVKEDILKNIPLKKYGECKDVANAALFLASKMSDYITGQVITVDGGMVM